MWRWKSSRNKTGTTAVHALQGAFKRGGMETWDRFHIYCWTLSSLEFLFLLPSLLFSLSLMARIDRDPSALYQGICHIDMFFKFERLPLIGTPQWPLDYYWIWTLKIDRGIVFWPIIYRAKKRLDPIVLQWLFSLNNQKICNNLIKCMKFNKWKWKMKLESREQLESKGMFLAQGHG